MLADCVRILRVQQNPPGVVWGLGVLGQVLFTWKYDGKSFGIEKKSGGGGGQGSFTWNYERKGFGKNHLKVCVWGGGGGGGSPWLRFIYIEI